MSWPSKTGASSAARWSPVSQPSTSTSEVLAGVPNPSKLQHTVRHGASSYESAGFARHILSRTGFKMWMLGASHGLQNTVP
jgi:hypothetical protein